MATSEPVKVELPEGTVYVHIRAADVDRARLEVTTDPDRDTKGYVKLRGREYRIHYYMTRHPEPVKNLRTGRMIRWQVTDVPYNGGNRNSNGAQVDYTSPVDDKLDALRDRALDIFAEQHPKWQRESERLRIESDLGRATGEVDRLARELREAEAKAAALRSRLSSFRL